MSEKAHAGGQPEPVKHSSKPVSITQQCADLSVKLDAAVAAQDAAAIETCWKEMDILYHKIGSHASQESRQHVAALSARFHHFAPRGEA